MLILSQYHIFDPQKSNICSVALRAGNPWVMQSTLYIFHPRPLFSSHSINFHTWSLARRSKVSLGPNRCSTMPNFYHSLFSMVLFLQIIIICGENVCNSNGQACLCLCKPYLPYIRMYIFLCGNKYAFIYLFIYQVGLKLPLKRQRFSYHQL